MSEWLALEQDQPACLHELAARFGPLFTVQAPGRKPRVHVAEPDAISLFSRHADQLRVNGPTLFRPLVGERSLTFLNGAEHRAARKLTARALHCDDPDALALRMARIARAEVAALPGPPGLPLETFANRVTRRVILELTFGELPAAEAHRLLDALDAAMATLHAEHTVLLTRRHAELGNAFTAARNELHLLLHHQLAREGGGSGTILGRLVGDTSLSADEIVTHLVTLLVGGHETTSAALSWALRCVSAAPGAGDRIRGEVVRSDGRLLELPYLKAACTEALRHSPPLPNGITREVTVEFTAADHTFPAGTQLVPCISVIHHRPEVYPEPERFVPERFLQRRPAPGHHLPFGAGPRYCPGAALAFRELMVVIGVTVGDPRVRITAPDGDRPRSMGPTTRIPLTATIHRLRR